VLHQRGTFTETRIKRLADTKKITITHKQRHLIDHVILQLFT
jgi:hypothetical protein